MCDPLSWDDSHASGLGNAGRGNQPRLSCPRDSGASNNMDISRGLRDLSEAHVESVLRYVGKPLPIAETSILALVLSQLLGGPVTEEDVGEVLEASPIDLPVETTAALIDTFHRMIDIRFGTGQ
jgi:hypothetical protein